MLAEQKLAEQNESLDGRRLRLAQSTASPLTIAGLGSLATVAFAHLPLWPTDLWDHINYGHWILRNHAVPRHEPLLGHSGAAPMVDIAWLSQTGLAVIYDFQGVAGLQFVHGLLVAIALTATAWGVGRITQSFLAGIAAAGIFLALNWHPFLVIRPQLVGVALFALLVSLLASNVLLQRRWLFVVPIFFVIWANCHGSFTLGLMLLGIAAGSRFADEWMRAGSLRTAFADFAFRRLTLLTILCALAALIHPCGASVYTEVLSVARHPNIRDMFEWRPLSLSTYQGRVFAIVALFLAAAVVISPRRIRTDEFLLLVVTVALTLISSRMINWLAPVMAVSIAVHGCAAWRPFFPATGTPARPITGKTTGEAIGKPMMLCVAALCGIAFLSTPLALQLLSRQRAVPADSVTRRTPVAAAEFLNTIDLPTGRAFCSAEWSGFLMCLGPADFRPLVNLHVHVIPVPVWNDYMRIIGGTAAWSQLFERYDIRLAVADKARHVTLIERLRNDAAWTSVFEDGQAAVFVKR